MNASVCEAEERRYAKIYTQGDVNRVCATASSIELAKEITRECILEKEIRSRSDGLGTSVY